MMIAPRANKRRGLATTLVAFSGLLILGAPPLLRAEDLTREQVGEQCFKLFHEEDAPNEELRSFCEERLKRLVTLVITPTRQKQSLQTVPASADLVTERDLERMRPDTVAEIARDVPGVELTDAGQAGLKRLRIRGEESRRVAILIDGQRFADERDTGTPLLISPEMIDRIEILRSTGSVLYGSRGIGGVVNIITKKGGHHPVQASVSSSYHSGSHGVQHFASLFGRKDGFLYRAAGSSANHSDRRSAGGPIENTSFDNDGALLFFGKEWEQRSLGVLVDNFNADSHVYVEPRVRTAPPFRDFRIDAPQRDRSKAALFYDQDDPGGFLKRLHFDLYRQKSERQFDTFSEIEISSPQGLRLRTAENLADSTLSTIGTNGQLDIVPIGKHSAILGYELTLDELDQLRVEHSTLDGRPLPSQELFDSASQHSFELFVQDGYELTEGLSLTAGLRGYYIESELERSTRESLSPTVTRDWHGVAALGVRSIVSDYTTLWTGWSQGFVFPSPVQLSTGAVAGQSFVVPNSELSSETSNSFEVGGRYNEGNFSSELSFFYVRAQDYIDHVPCFDCSGPRDRRYVNIASAQTIGLEAKVRHSFELVTPFASISLLRRRFEQEISSTYNTGLPLFAGRVGFLAESAMRHGVKPWAQIFLRAASSADEKEASGELLHYSGWGTLNLSLGANFGRREDYRLVVELVNLNNKSYTPATENIPALGPSAVLTFAVDFS